MTDPNDVLIEETSLDERQGLRTRPILNIISLLLVVGALVALAPRFAPPLLGKLFPAGPTPTPPPFRGQNLYVSSTYGVTALNAASGAKRWKNYPPCAAMAQLPGELICAAPSTVLALSAQNGRQIWQFDLVGNPDIPAQQIVVVEGVVCVSFAGISEGDQTLPAQVVALDALRGTLLWNYHAQAGPLELTGASSAIMLNGFESGPTPTSIITALDPKTGRHLWQYVVPGWLNNFDVIYDASSGTLLLKGETDLIALASANGHVIWQTQTQLIFASPPIIAGILYDITEQFPTAQKNGLTAGADSTRIALAAGPSLAAVAIDLRTGTIRWRAPFTADASAIIAAGSDGLAIMSQRLDGSQEILLMNMRDGSFRWNHLLSSSAGSLITADAHLLYIADNTGIIALDLQQGTQRWFSQADDQARGYEALAGGALYLSGTTSITAISVATGSRLWQSIFIDPPIIPLLVGS